MLITGSVTVCLDLLCIYVSWERWTERGWRDGQRCLACLQSTCRKSQSQQQRSGNAVHPSRAKGKSTAIARDGLSLSKDRQLSGSKGTSNWWAIPVLQICWDNITLSCPLSWVAYVLNCLVMRSEGKNAPRITFDLHISSMTKRQWTSDYTQHCLCTCVATLLM